MLLHTWKTFFGDEGVGGAGKGVDAWLPDRAGLCAAAVLPPPPRPPPAVDVCLPPRVSRGFCLYASAGVELAHPILFLFFISFFPPLFQTKKLFVPDLAVNCAHVKQTLCAPMVLFSDVSPRVLPQPVSAKGLIKYSSDAEEVVLRNIDDALYI